MHGANALLLFAPPPPSATYGSFCAYDFHRGVSPVSGPAADREVHSAVVWRRPGGLDDVPVVLPDAAARGLRVRPSVDFAADPAPAGDVARGIAPLVARAAPDHASGELEGPRGRRPQREDSPAADRHDRPAVFCPLLDRAPDPAVVQPDQSGAVTVPALRPVERGFVARAPELPRVFRGEVHAARPGQPMVGRAGAVRGLLRLLCLPRLEARGSAGGRRVPAGGALRRRRRPRMVRQPP